MPSNTISERGFVPESRQVVLTPVAVERSHHCQTPVLLQSVAEIRAEFLRGATGSPSLLNSSCTAAR
jgi:hypothetical protein